MNILRPKKYLKKTADELYQQIKNMIKVMISVAERKSIEEPPLKKTKREEEGWYFRYDQVSQAATQNRDES